MKYSKATNYALHSMLYLVAAPQGEAIGVQALAQLQKISPTYLSKVLSKLVKAGLIASNTGLYGGYQLLKPKEDISFLEVIEAIEGKGSLFNCGLPHHGPHCLIDQTMNEAETLMEQHLAQKKLVELLQHIGEARLVDIANKFS
jgi:Rrf2 family protein